MVFETRSVMEKEIRLTDVQWLHIQDRHIETGGQLEKMKETLQKPDFVDYDAQEDVYHYLKKFQKTPVTRKFMLVVVKHLNGDGFVITSFFISIPKMEGKERRYENQYFD